MAVWPLKGHAPSQKNLKRTAVRGPTDSGRPLVTDFYWNPWIPSQDSMSHGPKPLLFMLIKFIANIAIKNLLKSGNFWFRQLNLCFYIFFMYFCFLSWCNMCIIYLFVLNFLNFVMHMFMAVNCLWQWPTPKLKLLGHCAHPAFYYLYNLVCLRLFFNVLKWGNTVVNSAKQ